MSSEGRAGPRADGGVASVDAGSPVLVVGAIALLLAAVGGAALLSLPDDETTTESREPLDGVPSEVDYVGYVDTDTYRSDADAAHATDRALRFQSLVQFYDGPPFRESFALGVRESALDTTAVREVTYFGRHDSGYEARIVVGNWTAADLAAAVEADANVTLERSDLNGTTLYRGGGLAVARLGNDSANTVLAVGNETAVRDALEVTTGEAETDGVAGPLRSEFEEREGYVRFAYRFRPFRVPEYPFVGGAVESVEYVSSEYVLNRSTTAAAGTATPSADPPNVSVAIDITTADAESARSVRTIMNAGVTFYRVESRNETLRDELATVDVPEAEGRSVTLRYESSPRMLRVLVRGLFRYQPEPSGRLVVDTRAEVRP
ncbi:hypothetical protein N0B31_05675 [Salinirubellus salinus]|uniref:Uncharacterized protein n=1 Tax=Salinirubellus salinus TaxID=1364945 RepID=A0A9E7UCG2_9EURY|nr:hypothetical protein [Salinirubellus salinus]UWM55774.1 hypothetical protein N0B31_05675 [Salinirubellus salinus]